MTARNRAWMDTETTGLHRQRRAWEIAAIVRPGDGTRADDIEFSVFVDIADLDLTNAEPDALAFGRFWQRHPQAHLVPLVGSLLGVERDLPATPPTGAVRREWEALATLAELTKGSTIHGSNPSFDVETLSPRMVVSRLEPGWHYHPEDVPSVARGWLLGRGHRDVPRKSDQVSALCGVDPAKYDRHTALGDCRWLRDLSDAIEMDGTPAWDETRCHCCGGPNVVAWSAPSPLWNAVMRGGSIVNKDEFDGIVCPTCFAQLAEARGIAQLWKFYAERVHVPLETVTPSGRVWNPATWMFEEPSGVAS